MERSSAHLQPHPVEIAERALNKRIADWLAKGPPPRQIHRHRFHVVTRVCVDCGTTEKAHYAISYGYGLPCVVTIRPDDHLGAVDA